MILSMTQKYRHKGNGHIYEIIRQEDFADFTIKQGPENEWEEVIAYMDCETYQPFLTGKKRFLDRFEKVGAVDTPDLKKENDDLREKLKMAILIGLTVCKDRGMQGFSNRHDELKYYELQESIDRLETMQKEIS